MLKPILCFILVVSFFSVNAQGASPAVKYSQVLLKAIRDKLPSEEVLKELEQYSASDLEKELVNDTLKKTFWVNIYNAFIQLQLQKQSKRTVINKKFLDEKVVKIAGVNYSFNKIEQKMLSVPVLEQWDYRLLFVLNKGTVGSPDIVIYDAKKLDASLDVVTKLYLKRVSRMDEEGFGAEVPNVFKKRQRDLGGKRKVIEILRKNEVIYMNVLPKLKYRKTDATVKAAMFMTDELLQLYLK